MESRFVIEIGFDDASEAAEFLASMREFGLIDEDEPITVTTIDDEQTQIGVERLRPSLN